jgi:uncharacterized membrane protein YqhA
MDRLLLASRYLVVLAVLAALAGAAAVLLYGVSVLAYLVIELVGTSDFSGEAIKSASLNFIQLIDLLFLGVALYIIALGLYHLFVDASLRLPRWLKIEDFDELKIVLISVVVLILVINFTGMVVDWDGHSAILDLGLAVAAVVAALGLVLYVHVVSSRRPGRRTDGDPTRTPNEPSQRQRQRPVE